MKEIFEAIESLDFKTAKHLLNTKNFDINCVNENGQSLLIQCCTSTCSSSHEEIIDILLAKKIDANIQDCYGQNALMYTFELQRPQVSKKLINLTDLNNSNEDGKYPLTLAIYHNRQDLIEMVLGTIETSQDVKSFQSQLRDNHSLTKYTQERLEQFFLYFKLGNHLNDKINTSKIKI